MAIAQWRQQLGKTQVTLLGGLEILYRPTPGGPAQVVSPELAHGAASLVLEDGAESVYLFNYFPNSLPKPVYRDTLRAMTSLASVRRVPRTVGVTYRDIIAPGESYQPPLPAKGKEANFSMMLGAEPPANWQRAVVIGIGPGTSMPPAAPLVWFDGTPCDFVEQQSADKGPGLMTFRIPAVAWAKSRTHAVKVSSRDETPLVIERVEVTVKP
jgi:hypothetical protein